MYSNKTPNLKLPQYLSTDVPSIMSDFNEAMRLIDEAVGSGGGGGEPYVLPIATEDVLGGVKGFAGLSIDQYGNLSGNTINSRFSRLWGKDNQIWHDYEGNNEVAWSSEIMGNRKDMLILVNIDYEVYYPSEYTDIVTPYAFTVIPSEYQYAYYLMTKQFEHYPDMHSGTSTQYKYSGATLMYVPAESVAEVGLMADNLYSGVAKVKYDFEIFRLAEIG